MSKYIVVPDSFKGTMSSIEICDIIEKGILNNDSEAEIIKIPIADGGEGSVDCLISIFGGEKIEIEVSGPYFERIDSFYGLIEDGHTAVIEMSAAAGLPLVGERKNAGLTTTFGVGELMTDAKQRGARKIIMCLGGSATNDCGAGMLSALGVRFYNAENKAFIPTGFSLSEVEQIDTSSLSVFLEDIELLSMCDIDNPLCGKSGAAYIFAKQKGASDREIQILDDNLSYFSNLSKKYLNNCSSEFCGAGAAGGMGFAMNAFLKSKMRRGIDVILDIISFDKIISDSDLVFTGEGKLDSQSIDGKVISGIAKRCKKQGAKLIAVVGAIGDDIEKVYDLGVTGILCTTRLPISFSEIVKRTKNDLFLTIDNFMKMYQGLRQAK